MICWVALTGQSGREILGYRVSIELERRADSTSNLTDVTFGPAMNPMRVEGVALFATRDAVRPIQRVPLTVPRDVAQGETMSFSPGHIQIIT